MAIRKITADDLRRMENQEGLILQGCGGDLMEWLDGINQMFREENILKEGTGFANAYAFEHRGRTCLMFPFQDVKLDGGKLAMWRLRSYDTFGGTWLSDFVPNQLGGFEKQKPKCPLIGENGNIFNLIGIAARTLRQAGQPEQAKEMTNRILQCGSYESALDVMGEYVEITENMAQDEDMESYDAMDMSY